MNFISCKLKKPQKLWISSFASLKNLKKHEFHFLQSYKTSKNMDFIFCKLKKTRVAILSFFLFLEVKCSNSDLWHQVSILHFCMHNLRHIKIHQPIQIVRSQSSCAKAWQSDLWEVILITSHRYTSTYF